MDRTAVCLGSARSSSLRTKILLHCQTHIDENSFLLLRSCRVYHVTFLRWILKPESLDVLCILFSRMIFSFFSPVALIFQLWRLSAWIMFMACLCLPVWHRRYIPGLRDNRDGDSVNILPRHRDNHWSLSSCKILLLFRDNGDNIFCPHLFFLLKLCISVSHLDCGITYHFKIKFIKSYRVNSNDDLGSILYVSLKCYRFV